MTLKVINAGRGRRLVQLVGILALGIAAVAAPAAYTLLGRHHHFKPHYVETE